MFPNNRIDVT